MAEPKGNLTALEQVLTPILEELDVATQGGHHLLSLINEQKWDDTTKQIAFLLEKIELIERAQQPILAELEHSYSVEMLDNLRDVLERIHQEVAKLEQLEAAQTVAHDDLATPIPINAIANVKDTAAFLCEFQLIPLFRATKETFYFWGRIDKSPELLRQYYANEFTQHHQNPYVASGEELPYQVSVVVVGYNKLELTKRCIESVLANTDFAKLNCELILVDHGSSDGTWEYMQSIPNARVLHFKHNMMVAMFPMLPQICRSRFYVHVANDIVVTKDWLEILLACMQSDPKIATAVPATCNMSNGQSDSVPTDDCAELIEIAKKHNKVNPLLWNDRIKVYPSMGIFSVPILNQIGFWDPALYKFFTCDDDFCLRARRAGFRNVLCEDVFCFHQHHGTMQATIESSENLKDLLIALYKKKNGVDPWYFGVMYNTDILEYLQTEIQNNQILQDKVLDCNEKLNILLINGGAGDTALQLKNVLKRLGKQGLGKQVDIYHIQTTTEYVDDFKHFATDYACVEPQDLTKAIQESFPQVKFAFICIEKGLEQSSLTKELVEAVRSRMLEGGVLYFDLLNSIKISDEKVFKEFILKRVPLEEWGTLSYRQLSSLALLINQRYKVLRLLNQYICHERNIGKMLGVIKNFYPDANEAEMANALTCHYFFVVQKTTA